VLEKRRFHHFTQHWQGFFEVKYQLFTTSSFSAAVSQSCNIFAVHIFGKKLPQSRNFYLKIYLDLGDRDLKKREGNQS
jgi:hypothetical protein